MGKLELILKESYGLQHLKPLIYFANLCAFCPFYDFKNRKLAYEDQHKWYSISLAILIVTFHVGGEMNTINKYLSNKPVTTVTLYLMMYSLLTILIVITIWNSIIKNKQNWVDFLNALHAIDTKLFYVESSGSILTFSFKLIVFQVLVQSILILSDGILFLQGRSFFTIANFILQRINFGFAFVLVMLISFLSLSIKKRFQFLNKKLEHLFNPLGKSMIMRNLNFCRSESMSYFGKIGNICRIHYEYSYMGDVIDLFNLIFGHSLFLLIFVILLSQLYHINEYLVKNDNSITSFSLKMLVNTTVLVRNI